jgi:hypothetical protein
VSALASAAAADERLRIAVVTSILAVFVVGVAWSLWALGRERRKPATPIAVRATATAVDAATRDLAASAARAVAGESQRIRSTPTSRRATRHSRRPARRPGRIAALLGGLALRMGGRRRRVVPWVDPAPPIEHPPAPPAPEPVPDPAPPVGRHHVNDEPTRPLPLVGNGSYVPVTASGRASVPPWRPGGDPQDVVTAAFTRAGVPVDALAAAMATGEELRRWADSRAGDPDATELLHRIGPDDGQMATGRWPQ